MSIEWKLEDVAPQPEEITIKGKTYKLAPFSLDDAAYFESTWQTADVVKEFLIRMVKSPRQVLCEVGYRLMTYDLDVEDCKQAKADFPTLKIFMRSMSELESNNNNFMVHVLNAYGKSFKKNITPEVPKVVEEIGDAAVKAESFLTASNLGKIIFFIKKIFSFFGKRNKKANI